MARMMIMTRALASLAIIAACLADVVVSQAVVVASNDTAALPTIEGQLILVTKTSSGGSNSYLSPLTAAMGIGQSTASVLSIRVPQTGEGTLVLTDLSTAANLTGNDLAYICCDYDPATTNIDPSTVFNSVITQSNQPAAVILYSLFSEVCNVTGGSYDFGTTLTMTRRADSTSLDGMVRMSSSPPDAVIEAVNATSTTAAPGATSTGVSSGNSNAPTTAVAMSILYSITGIITLLFLIIIATGAVRAHRHPERYGPRRGLPGGRTRQSRAKGLARAMLETLPIVKFGQEEQAKPDAQGNSNNIELESGTRDISENAASPTGDSALDNGKGQQTNGDEMATATTGTAAAAAAAAEADNGNATAAATRVDSGMGPDTQASAAGGLGGSARAGAGAAGGGSGGGHNEEREGDLGCSICTDDFTRGEDVRVLPCNHKYHPACIDPWLLNVSGTCPLCRIDLRPTPSHASDPAADGNTDPAAASSAPNTSAAATAAVAADTSRRRRISRLRLDLHLLSNASPDERIAALRQLRAEDRAARRASTTTTNTAAAAGGRGGAGGEGEQQQQQQQQQSRRASLTTRLKETFGRSAGVRMATRRGGGGGGAGTATATTATMQQEGEAASMTVGSRDGAREQEEGQNVSEGQSQAQQPVEPATARTPETAPTETALSETAPAPAAATATATHPSVEAERAASAEVQPVRDH